jgi:hypothetical protein
MLRSLLTTLCFALVPACYFKPKNQGSQETVLKSHGQRVQACKIRSGSMLCILNRDASSLRIDVNRPDQEFCQLNFVTTVGNEVDFSGVAAKVAVSSLDAQTGELVTLEPRLSALNTELSYGTGGVLGYANSFTFSVMGEESLEQVFTMELEISESDIVGLYASSCPEDRETVGGNSEDQGSSGGSIDGTEGGFVPGDE